MFFGIAVIVIGLVFLMQALGLVPGSVWSVIWPCILIIIGIGIIYKERGKCYCGEHHKKEGK
jgi:uncharacterized membrane protein